MFISFAVENYRSFGNRSVLSMVASNDKTYIDTHTFSPSELPSVRLLKSVVIYGPNASGKSNLIKAMFFLSNFVRYSATDKQSDDPIPVVHNKLLYSGDNVKPSVFQVVFMHQGIRYMYNIAVDSKSVKEETLTAYPIGKKQLWYSRVYNQNTNIYDWNFGTHLKGENERISKFVRPNSLYLSHAAQNNHPQLSIVFEWFNRRFLGVSNIRFARDYTANMCIEDKDFHQSVIKFLKIADAGIEQLNLEKVSYPQNISVSENQQSEDDTTKTKQAGRIIIRTSHKLKDSDNFVEFSMGMESDGTQRLFEYSGPFIDVLKTGKTLYIDEIDRSMHPALTRHLISLFHNEETNKNNAQLICTSHDTSLLDQKLLRRDQVWLVKKDDLSSSEIYPLLDYSPRKDESLQKGYLYGRYGAIPFIEE